MPIYGDDDQFERDTEFAHPGSNSALRAASSRNPRNLPCPTCRKPNKLTPADRARGYQCDGCADRDEGTYCRGGMTVGNDDDEEAIVRGQEGA